MKHLLLSFLLLALVCHNSHSQSAENSGCCKFSISLLGGIGIPSGDFKTYTTIPDPLHYFGYNIAGEGKVGPGGKIAVHSVFRNHFGLAASVYYNSFATTYKNPDELFVNDFLYSDNTYDKYEADAWKAGGLQLGGLYEFALNKLRIGFKALAGVQIVNSPKTTLTIFDTDYYITERIFVQSPVKSTAFSYGGGAWLNYPLSRHLSLSLAAEYTGASHDFTEGNLEEHRTASTGTKSSFNHTISFSKNVSFVSVMTGLTYNFGQNQKPKISTDTLRPSNRFQFSIAAGVSIPVGDFSSFTEIPVKDRYTNFNTAGEGWMGYGGNFGIRYVLTRKLGLAGSLYFNTFPTEDKESETLYENDYQFNPWKVLSYESGSWNTGGVLLGGYFEVPVSTAHFGIQLKGGFQYASCPQTTSLSGKFNNIDPMWSGDSVFYKVNQPGMTDITFALNGSCYFRFAVGKKSSLTLESEYTTANHSFGPEDAEISTWGGWNGNNKKNTPVSFNKKISFVNIMLRWGFYL